LAQETPLAEQPMTLHIASEREQVVQDQPGSELPERYPVGSVVRKGEGEGSNKVGSNPQQYLPLRQGFENEPEVVLFEVAQATVDETARSGTGAGGTIPPVHDDHRHPAHRGIPGNSGAGYSRPHDQQVRTGAGQVRQRSRERGHLSLSHEHASVGATIDRPSTWFSWHATLIPSGARVLDLACGTGRHSLAAAELGARVTAIDQDPVRIAVGKQEAARRQLDITWVEHNLEHPIPVTGPFDLVLCFNYLDRPRLPGILHLLAPGGLLIMETFLEAQRRLGWGPENPEHLLASGELVHLVSPLVPIYGREVLEPLPGERWRAVSSIVARRL